MATQRALAAAMLAMALVATCVAESSDPVTLASLLQKQKGGSIQAATSYPEAHSTRACLKLKNVQNCDVFGLASALYLEHEMTCCDAQHPYDSMHPSDPFMPFASNVGKCAVRLDPFYSAFLPSGAWDSVDRVTEVTQVGTFSLTCELSHGAEQCGAGMCEDMTLEAKGPVYAVPDAAIVAPITSLDGLDVCLNTIQSIITQAGQDLLGDLDLSGLQDLQEDVDTLTNSLSTVQGDVQELEDKTQDSFDAVQTALDTQAESLSTLESNINSNFADLDESLLQQFNGIDSRFDGIDLRFDEVDERINSLVDTVGEAQSDVNDLEERVADLEGDFDTLVEDTDDKFDAVGLRLDDAESRLGFAESDITDLQGRVDLLEADAEETSAAITDAQEDIGDLQGRVSTLEVELETLEGEVDTCCNSGIVNRAGRNHTRRAPAPVPRAPVPRANRTKSAPKAPHNPRANSTTHAPKAPHTPRPEGVTRGGATRPRHSSPSAKANTTRPTAPGGSAPTPTQAARPHRNRTSVTTPRPSKPVLTPHHGSNPKADHTRSVRPKPAPLELPSVTIPKIKTGPANKAHGKPKHPGPARQAPRPRVGQKLLKMLPKPLHAGAQAQSYRRGANTGNVYVRGTAVIASGRVTVSSRHTKLQYDAGSLQLNLFTGPAAGNPSIVPTSTTLIVEPYRLDMKLKRTNRDYR